MKPDFFLDRARCLAESFCDGKLFQVPRTRHNWPLEQARIAGKAVLTLTGAWQIWRESRFADRAWEILLEVTGWPGWTWDKLNQPYDLTTGELAATFSLASNALDGWLGDDRKQTLRHAVHRHVILGILECYREDKPADQQQWWLRAGSNWNAVCNGGALMAALEWPDFEESARVESLVFPGLEVYCREGIQPDGSSLESIGYWQYGLIYFSRALLAWEARHGRSHHLLDRPAFREGLDFPFDFSPGGAAIGFGDANYLSPPATLLPLFLRGGRKDLGIEVLARLASSWDGKDPTQFDPYVEPWPDEIAAALHAADCSGHPRLVPSKMRVYPNCGWTVFHRGNASLSFRAGSTRVLHAMRELLAVNVAVGGVTVLSGCENWPYPAGWFSEEKRDPVRGRSRGLYWEDNTTSKNAPLVNGIGQVDYADSVWSADSGQLCVRADATSAYPLFVRKVERSVRMVADGFELSDTWESVSPSWFEARFHVPTGIPVALNGGSVVVGSDVRKVALSFFSQDGNVRVTISDAQPSIPSKPPTTMIRAWVEKPLLTCQLTTLIKP